jgi:hypothetical protein
MGTMYDGIRNALDREFRIERGALRDLRRLKRKLWALKISLKFPRLNPRVIYISKLVPKYLQGDASDDRAVKRVNRSVDDAVHIIQQLGPKFEVLSRLADGVRTQLADLRSNASRAGAEAIQTLTADEEKIVTTVLGIRQELDVILEHLERFQNFRSNWIYGTVAVPKVFGRYTKDRRCCYMDYRDATGKRDYDGANVLYNDICHTNIETLAKINGALARLFRLQKRTKSQLKRHRAAFQST